MNHLPPRLRPPDRPSSVTDRALPRLTPRESAAQERSLGTVWRRFKQPLPLIGVGLIVIALGGYVLVARQTRSESEVVAIALSLPAGTVLHSDDLELVRLGAAPALLAKLVPASHESTLVGMRLAAPVTAGLPLPQASLTGVDGGPAAFTLSVGEIHALGGDLQPGDRVSVLATFTSPNGTASSRVVARDLVVLAVGQAPAGLDPASATIPVMVALPDPTIATELALANNVGRIDLLRDGADTAARIPTVTGGAADQ
jgi:Flp pilus assembly protein CpaB